MTVTTRIFKHNVTGDFVCVLCGNYFEQHMVAVLLVEAEGESEKEIGDVCPECLKSGVVGVHERIAENINRLFRERSDLIHLKHLMNSVEEWVTVEQLEQAEREMEEHIKGDWNGLE